MSCSSRAVGAAVARLAGQRGWDVAVNYSQSKEKAEAVANEVRAAGQKAMIVQADVGIEKDIARMFEEIDDGLGSPDAVVNNAGVDYDTLIADFELGRFRRTFDINIFGPALIAKEAINRMSTRLGGNGGVIINVSSISSRTGGWPRDVPYAATKGALDSFTIGLAKEVGPEGIRVVWCGVRAAGSDAHGNLGRQSGRSRRRDGGRQQRSTAAPHGRA